MGIIVEIQGKRIHATQENKSKIRLENEKKHTKQKAKENNIDKNYERKTTKEEEHIIKNKTNQISQGTRVQPEKMETQSPILASSKMEDYKTPNGKGRKMKGNKETPKYPNMATENKLTSESPLITPPTTHTPCIAKPKKHLTYQEESLTKIKHKTEKIGEIRNIT